MAATLRIDTLKFAKSLTDAGLSREAAEAIAQGVAGADVSDLATKTDIAELKADIYNRLWVMGLGIVGLTVALMKLLPG
jgi:hypothetical protein